MASMTMTPDSGASAMSKYYAKKISDLTTVSAKCCFNHCNEIQYVIIQSLITLSFTLSL